MQDTGQNSLQFLTDDTEDYTQLTAVEDGDADITSSLFLAVEEEAPKAMEPSSEAGPTFNRTFNGVSFDSFGGELWQRAGAQLGLDEAVAMNANSIALTPRLWQDSATASHVYNSEDQTESLASVDLMIKTAHARGLQVMLKPHINSHDRSFSGTWAPEDADAWFDSYTAELLNFARIAEANNVEMFSIANELQTITSGAYTEHWLELIAEVREVYSGQITLASQYWRLNEIEFLDKLDFIGVNAYFPLSDKDVPTADEVYDAWTSPGAAYASKNFGGLSVVDYTKALSEKYDKPVIITEVGFRSIEGAATAPGNYAMEGAANDDVQTALYEGFMRAWGEQGDWFQGTFFWGWNIAEGHEGDYSVQGNDAYDLVADAFGGGTQEASFALASLSAESPSEDTVDITVRVSGKSNDVVTPTMLVALDGQTVGLVTVEHNVRKGDFGEYHFTVADADPSVLSVFFENPDKGTGLYVDYVEVDGVRYEAEAFGVVNNAIPNDYQTFSWAETLWTDGALIFDLKNGIANGEYITSTVSGWGEDIEGTSDKDYITLSGGNHTVATGAGDDIVDAKKAKGNILDTGAGNDTVQGGAGADQITTGDGIDHIIVVEHGGFDTVTDFDVAQDVLDFRYANTSSTGFDMSHEVVDGVAGTLVTFRDTKVFLVGVDPLTLRPTNFAFTYSNTQGEEAIPAPAVELLFSHDGEALDLAVDENETDVTIVEATRSDGGAVRYSLLGGADQALFSIDAVTGALRFKEAPDYDTPALLGRDTPFEVIVRAATPEGVTADQTVFVSVDNVNDNAPIFDEAAGQKTFQVDEGTTDIARLSTQDADGSEVIYSIAGGADADLFRIDTETGDLSFLAAPDWERPEDQGGDNIYDVIVRATDGEHHVDKSLSVKVDNLSEAIRDQMGESRSDVTAYRFDANWAVTSVTTSTTVKMTTADKTVYKEYDADWKLQSVTAVRVNGDKEFHFHYNDKWEFVGAEVLEMGHQTTIYHYDEDWTATKHEIFRVEDGKAKLFSHDLVSGEKSFQIATRVDDGLSIQFFDGNSQSQGGEYVKVDEGSVLTQTFAADWSTTGAEIVQTDLADIAADDVIMDWYLG
ncbi:glycoside hydrolase family 113 [Parvularcula bermudensis]|nr:carbohydrate-binding domain-containing protein [Parvularcula bermudensis]